MGNCLDSPLEMSRGAENVSVHGESEGDKKESCRDDFYRWATIPSTVNLTLVKEFCEGIVLYTPELLRNLTP